jgi:hypothetical protein
VIFRGARGVGDEVEGAPGTRFGEIERRRQETGVHGEQLARGFQETGDTHAMSEKGFCGDKGNRQFADQSAHTFAFGTIIGFCAASMTVDATDI